MNLCQVLLANLLTRCDKNNETKVHLAKNQKNKKRASVETAHETQRQLYFVGYQRVAKPKHANKGLANISDAKQKNHNY